MKYTAELRTNNPFFGMLSKFFDSIWFPVILGTVCIFTSVSGMEFYVPAYWAMTAFVLLGFFCASSCKIIFAPLILLYYGIGMDVSSVESVERGISFNNVLENFDPAGLNSLLICGFVMLAGLVLKLITSGALADATGKRYRTVTGKKAPYMGHFGPGLLIFGSALAVNGAWSDKWVPECIIFGMLEFIGFTLVYFLCLVIFRSEEVRRIRNGENADKKGGIASLFLPNPDAVTYACFVLTILGLEISGEFVLLLTKIHDIYFVFDANGLLAEIKRDYGLFSWGIPNLVAATLAMTVPATLFLAYRTKSRVLSGLLYLANLFILSVIILTNCRDAIIFGLLFTLVMLVVSCFTGKKKLFFLFLLIMTAGAGIFIVQLVLSEYGGSAAASEFFETIMRLDIFGEDRFILWHNGLQDFRNYPVFGVGLFDGGFDGQPFNVLCDMYHNIGVQLLGSFGLVGTLAFLFHFKDYFTLIFKRFSVEKLFIVLIPVMSIALSLVDNYFWYLNIQIIYCFALAAAEALDVTAAGKNKNRTV